jgi:hypothetical protein
MKQHLFSVAPCGLVLPLLLFYYYYYYYYCYIGAISHYVRKASAYTRQHGTERHRRISMPRVGFEPTMAVFERPRATAQNTAMAGCYSLMCKLQALCGRMSMFVALLNCSHS